MQNKSFLIIAAIVAFIAMTAGGTVMYTNYKQRGIRNNNPGNIRSTSQKWQGQIGLDDKGFCIFDKPESGLRALSILLMNYQAKHGLDTVAKIISRYAPTNENDTKSYIASVSKKLNVSADEKINVREKLPQLIAAIVQHENGVQPYPAETINKGVALAGMSGAKAYA